MRPSWWTAVATTLLASTACRSTIGGGGDGPLETTSESADGDESSGDPSCELGGACVTPAPDGWEGPALFGQLGLAPDCPESMPLALEVSRGLSFEDPSCACSCDPASANCGNVRIEDIEPPCQGALGSSLLPTPETCLSLGFTAGPVKAVYVDPQPDGDCTPVAEVSVTEPTWDERFQLCAASSPAACDDGDACVAQTPGEGERVCVFKAGEHDCPSAYPTRELAYEDFDDQRTCECACGEPLGVTCSALVDLFDEVDCSGPALATLETGDPTCTSGASASHAQVRAPVTGGGECAPDGPGTPAGEVLATSAVTVCCS